ncbi:MAG: DNA replication/repair protein RecF [Marinicellaceae bacterium]
MYIKKLKIHDLRNITNTEFEFSKKINIFHGSNGSGKTSILEAIYFLSSGKSFRKGNFKNLINFNASSCTVFLECFNTQINDINSHTIAINKKKNGQWKGQHNGNKINSQSVITNLLPVVAIDPEVYRLVDFGPLYRRNFLDWLVFHVKHDYLLLWKKVNKCVKQLNTLYKNKAPSAEINLWEKTFINFSHELNSIREHFFYKIKPNILKLSLHMQKEINDLNLEFKKGWSINLSLEQQLEEDRLNNLKYGQLQHGPHKMDIKIFTGKHPASQTLSRGQKKILSITFYMAYIDLLLNESTKKPILCLDDFDAEIDKKKLSKAALFFKEKDTQIFITSVQKKKISKVFPEAELFHVEH